VHITRGALGLIGNEAELAGVLGHEIAHVTEKHTIKAIEKSNRIQMTTETVAGDREVLAQVTNLTYEHIIENSFDRNDEMASDKAGTTAANKAGYAPTGLSSFLQRLADRNKGAAEKRGLFASHPDIEARIKGIDNQIKNDKLAATATVEARYKKYIAYEATAQADIAMVEAGASGLAEGAPAKEEPKKEEEPKKKGFGLSSLAKPAGPEKQSAQVMASGGARGVDPERDAKGGSNPATVRVGVTAAEIAEFKKGIGA
jgi:predicted Zn-dependent protease